MQHAHSTQARSDFLIEVEIHAAFDGGRLRSARITQGLDRGATGEPPLHARHLSLNRPTPTQWTSGRCPAS